MPPCPASNLNILLMQIYLNEGKGIPGEKKRLYWVSLLEKDGYFFGWKAGSENAKQARENKQKSDAKLTHLFLDFDSH